MTDRFRIGLARALVLAVAVLTLTAPHLAAAPAGAQPPVPGGLHLSAPVRQMATTQIGGEPVATSQALAGACVAWKRHQRRVVKRVRRYGKWTRVVRVKRWRTCARRAAPAPLAPAPVPPPAPPPSAPTPEPEDPGLQRLGVKAAEWSFTLSRPQVAPGELLVELNNAGEDPHNLHLRREDAAGPEGAIATIGPAAQGRAKFVLPAGTYRLWCDLSEHAERGMEATLVVAE